MGGDNGSRGNVCRPLLAATKTLVKLSLNKKTSNSEENTLRTNPARTDARPDARTDGRTDGRADAQTHAQTHGRTDARTHKRTHKRTHRRTDARTHARTHARRFINIQPLFFFLRMGAYLRGWPGRCYAGTFRCFQSLRLKLIPLAKRLIIKSNTAVQRYGACVTMPSRSSLYGGG